MSTFTSAPMTAADGKTVTAWTPGPWVIGRNADGGPHIGTGRRFGPYGENVAIVTRPGPAERMAGAVDHSANNARLIAAAPDLYEALKDVLSWHDFADDMHKPIEVRAAYMRARAALTRAGGA